MAAEKFDRWETEDKFHDPKELERSRGKRIKELEVLLGEIDSQTKGARIYSGTSGAPGTVFILSKDRTAKKSAIKKEIKEVKKAVAASEKRVKEDKSILNF